MAVVKPKPWWIEPRKSMWLSALLALAPLVLAIRDGHPKPSSLQEAGHGAGHGWTPPFMSEGLGETESASRTLCPLLGKGRFLLWFVHLILQVPSQSQHVKLPILSSRELTLKFFFWKPQDLSDRVSWPCLNCEPEPKT